MLAVSAECAILLLYLYDFLYKSPFEILHTTTITANDYEYDYY